MERLVSPSGWSPRSSASRSGLRSLRGLTKLLDSPRSATVMKQLRSPWNQNFDPPALLMPGRREADPEHGRWRSRAGGRALVEGRSN